MVKFGIIGLLLAGIVLVLALYAYHENKNYFSMSSKKIPDAVTAGITMTIGKPFDLKVNQTAYFDPYAISLERIDTSSQNTYVFRVNNISPQEKYAINGAAYIEFSLSMGSTTSKEVNDFTITLLEDLGDHATLTIEEKNSGI